jgi:hypothetical protein
MRTSTGSNVKGHCPTPDEIAERTAAIRSTWSRYQRRVRAGLSPAINAVEISIVTAGTLEGRRGSMKLG